MAAALLAAPGALAAAFGLPAGLLTGAGAVLIASAALMLLAARRPAPRLVMLIVAGNWAWVAASLLVAATLAGTALGGAFLLIQAAAVAGLAWFEARLARAAAA